MAAVCSPINNLFELKTTRQYPKLTPAFKPGIQLCALSYLILPVCVLTLSRLSL